MQNVVSYTTVITVPNPDRTLLPGMTANVRVQVDRREDALRVTNAALRFRPPADERRRAGRRAAGRAPAPTTPAAGRQAGGAGGSGRRAGRGGGGGGLREMRATLVRDLALTAEQQTKLDAILEEARQAFAAAPRPRAVDDKARRAPSGGASGPRSGRRSGRS